MEAHAARNVRAAARQVEDAQAAEAETDSRRPVRVHHVQPLEHHMCRVDPVAQHRAIVP